MVSHRFKLLFLPAMAAALMAGRAAAMPAPAPQLHLSTHLHAFPHGSGSAAAASVEPALKLRLAHYLDSLGLYGSAPLAVGFTRGTEHLSDHGQVTLALLARTVLLPRASLMAVARPSGHTPARLARQRMHAIRHYLLQRGVRGYQISLSDTPTRRAASDTVIIDVAHRSSP